MVVNESTKRATFWMAGGHFRAFWAYLGGPEIHLGLFLGLEATLEPFGHIWEARRSISGYFGGQRDFEAHLGNLEVHLGLFWRVWMPHWGPFRACRKAYSGDLQVILPICEWGWRPLWVPFENVLKDTSYRWNINEHLSRGAEMV